MRIQKTIYAAAAVLSLAALPVLSGCGGGGAAEKSKVVIKPSQEAEPVAAAPGQPVTGEPAANAGAAPADPGATATFEGAVVFRGGAGAVPEMYRRPLIAVGAASKDPEVCARSEAIPNEELLVGEDGGVANVFIYLDRAPRGVQISPAPEEPVVFDQKNCVFFPRALIVRTGQTVEVHSSDAVAHNTNSTAAARNSGINTTVNEGQVVPFTYPNPERVPARVVCDFHPWMRAYHLPLDHPFMAVTDKDGKFKIENLPPGEYQFTIWHERAGYLDRGYKVTVKAGEALPPATIEYGAGEFAWFKGPDSPTVQVSSAR